MGQAHPSLSNASSGFASGLFASQLPSQFVPIVGRLYLSSTVFARTNISTTRFVDAYRTYIQTWQATMGKSKRRQQNPPSPPQRLPDSSNEQSVAGQGMLARVAGATAFAYLNSFLQASGFTSPWLAIPFLAMSALLTVSGLWALDGISRSLRWVATALVLVGFISVGRAQEVKRATEARLEARAQALLPLLEMTPENSNSQLRAFLERMPWTKSVEAGDLPDMIWALKLKTNALPWSITISRPKDASQYLTFATRVHSPTLGEYAADARRRIRSKALAELARLKVLHELDESDTLNLHVKTTLRISNLDEAQVVDAINLLRSAVALVGYCIDREGAPASDSGRVGT
jgi:hypothetical protein